MVNGKLRCVSSISVAILLSVWLFACDSHSKKFTEPEKDYSGFENGDIVCRLGNGIFSDYFRRASLKEELYSHVGIVCVDSTGGVSVIHCEVSEFTGMGGVKKEPLSVFINNVSDWGLYRLDTTSVVKSRVVGYASEYYENNTPFDFGFNSISDDKVYCTQMVALAINKAMSREVISPNGILNQKKYYAVDDIYLINEMILVKKYPEKD